MRNVIGHYSNFKLCDFTFTYFVGGIEINKCTFENYLDFQAGGHNKDKNSFSILSNKFHGFVNFFDCYFESEVIIKDNEFIKGTNLFGLHKASGQKTHFDVAPLIENNNGALDIKDEGDVESKSIFLLWEK